MSFDVNNCVTIIGFCWLLWWLPSPFPLLPALAALLFPLYPQDAAFTAFVVSMLFGGLYNAVTLVVSWREVAGGG